MLLANICFLKNKKQASFDNSVTTETTKQYTFFFPTEISKQKKKKERKGKIVKYINYKLRHVDTLKGTIITVEIDRKRN